MALSDIVNVQISVSSPGLARAGFGLPMILSYNATFDERLRTYSSLTGLATDFAFGTPEYRAASALFSQQPHVKQVAVGRGALKPTLVYTGSIVSVASSRVYTINVVGPGFSGTATVTSDSSATNDEIVDAMVTALNAVSGNNYTAAIVVGVGDTDTFTVTADAAGNWFSLEIAEANLTHMLLLQTHADPGVATDLAAIVDYDDSWYCLITLYNSNALVLAAAAWIETQYKIYAASSSEVSSATTAVTNSETLDDLHTQAYGRTFGDFHPDPSETSGAAWAGTWLPLEPGSYTAWGKQPKGLSKVKLTTTQRTNLLARKANVYEKLSDSVGAYTFGTMSDGSFIDVVRDLDWVRSDMTTRIVNAMLAVPKIPYTNAGIAIIQAAMEGTLDLAVKKGVFASYETQIPLITDIDEADIAARILPDLMWNAVLAGAIQSADPVTGAVTFTE